MNVAVRFAPGSHPIYSRALSGVDATACAKIRLTIALPSSVRAKAALPRKFRARPVRAVPCALKIRRTGARRVAVAMGCEFPNLKSHFRTLQALASRRIGFYSISPMAFKACRSNRNKDAVARLMLKV